MNKRDKYFFVLFGVYGKVSKLISNYLYKGNFLYFDISWKEFCDNDLGKIFEIKNLEGILITNNISPSNLIFIDCFIGDDCSIKKELFLHTKLLNISKAKFPKSQFIYLSTFEPQFAATTRYRRMKNILEKKLIDLGAKILRMGCPIKSKNTFQKSNKFSFTIKNFNNKFLIVPYTIIPNLINSINSLSRRKIISCYSGYMFVALNLNLYPKIVFLKKSSTNFCIFLPLQLIKFIFRSIVKICEFLRIPTKYIILLEKPISLISQQKFIYSIFSSY